MKDIQFAMVWILVFIIAVGLFRYFGIDNEFLTMSAGLATFVAGYFFGRDRKLAQSGAGT